MPASHWFFVIVGSIFIILGFVYTKEKYYKEFNPEEEKPKDLLEWIIFLKYPSNWIFSSYVVMKSFFFLSGILMVFIPIVSWYCPLNIFEYLERFPFIEVV